MINIKEESLNVYNENFKFWIESVDAYESVFFKHEHLPDFLKRVARLDIIRLVTKDHRPQSRKYWLENAEDDPSQIRAVAWTRSLLLSGLHFEWIGAHVWNHYSIEWLNNLFRANKTFNSYIKSVAYACARTNMRIAWQTLGCDLPSLSELNELVKIENTNIATQMLARLHLYMLQSIQLVFKVAYKKILTENDLFQTDRFSILKIWPDLFQEVILREKNLELSLKILVNCNRESIDSNNGSILRDAYTSFINESNTAVAFYIDSDLRCSESLRNQDVINETMFTYIAN